MSRIHEALKRAEMERAAQQAQSETSVSARFESTAVPFERATPAAEAPATEPAPLTLETLLERCPQGEWHPDPKTMLFLQPHSHSAGTEEFRTLRARLYKVREKHPLKTLLITSALPAEGKSFVAANLAQVFVRQHERRVLLIDADLRWSRLHLSLGTNLYPGLSDYLRGDADLFSIVQRSPQGNLFFIPGGRSASNPNELLINGRLRELLQQMAPLFDWIVIDSPPAIPVSDAALLAGLADGVLLVVRAAQTPFDLAQKVRQEFRDKPLLGAVLNCVPPAASYGSYYQYRYPQNGKRKD
ncbi:MAG: CpsD/CapB family tyrosine-protein kinase [Acidobacteriia bacterium]|jgi:capsular exopolysaccharide synthesis family protein|nr:CpsD/CapB family tyrosine-protein kinase [Terriglobia bacterium]